MGKYTHTHSHTNKTARLVRMCAGEKRERGERERERGERERRERERE